MWGSGYVIRASHGIGSERLNRGTVEWGNGVSMAPTHFRSCELNFSFCFSVQIICRPTNKQVHHILEGRLSGSGM